MSHTWNYRILAHKIGEDFRLKIHVVHYEEGIPVGYTEEGCVQGPDVSSIRWDLNKMIMATKKPILWADSLQEFKETK